MVPLAESYYGENWASLTSPVHGADLPKETAGRAGFAEHCGRVRRTPGLKNESMWYRIRYRIHGKWYRILPFLEFLEILPAQNKSRKPLLVNGF